MSRYISQSELARKAGISRQAVGKLVKGSLASAYVNRKIDTEHPDVVDYLAAKAEEHAELAASGSDVQPKTTKKIATKKKTSRSKKKAAAKKNSKELKVKLASGPKAETVGPAQVGGIPMDQLENLTVRQVMMRYGSIVGFKNYTDTLKNIADYKGRELKVQIQRQELVNREYVRGHVFGLLDVAFQRLVTDVPDALTPQLIGLIESGDEGMSELASQMIRDANSKALKSAKDTIMKDKVVGYA